MHSEMTSFRVMRRRGAEFRATRATNDIGSSNPNGDSPVVTNVAAPLIIWNEGCDFENAHSLPRSSSVSATRLLLCIALDNVTGADRSIFRLDAAYLFDIAEPLGDGVADSRNS